MQNSRPNYVVELLRRLSFVSFLGTAGRFGRGLCRKVRNHPAAVAAACGARAMGHARSPALANGELLGHERVVRTAVCRMRARMSHPYYHSFYLTK